MAINSRIPVGGRIQAFASSPTGMLPLIRTMQGIRSARKMLKAIADVKMNFLDSRINDGSMKIKGFLNNSVVKNIKNMPAKKFGIKISDVKSTKGILL
jgi:hypothetical protein